ncbi:MAG: amidohydrolase family protein [Dehalococcoidales bacterium]|nr:amidohydrolase family protein [Dehalococcoidales bacterium]
MIIDCHTHVLPPQVKSNCSQYTSWDKAFNAIYSGDKVKIATAEDLIESMDRDEVDVSVIVNYQWTTHDFCALTNDYILESVAKYPKRLIGLCAVSSYTDDASLKEIERCACGGIRGVGELRPDTLGIDYTKENIIKPFVDIIKKHKLIVSTHSTEPVGHLYPGKGKATPDLLLNFVSHFTELPVVCAHWGGGLPFYALMPEVKHALESVYFDTAISPYLYKPEIYQSVSKIVGVEKILFGSDFPVIGQAKVYNEIKDADLKKEDKEKILYGNVKRLLGI